MHKFCMELEIVIPTPVIWLNGAQLLNKPDS